MPEVGIQIEGLDKLRQAINKAPHIGAVESKRTIQRSFVRILGQVKRRAPVHTGNLRDRWEIRSQFFRGEMESRVKYAASVEFGSKPHTPPLAALETWAKKHGVNPYALQKAIAKRGTKAQPFFGESVDKSEPGINKEFAELLERIEGKMRGIAN